MSEQTVNEIHERINEELAPHGARIDAFYWCKHNYDEGCACRKPRPGLILSAANDLDIDLDQSLFIGDTRTDEECGANAGVRTHIMPTDGSLFEFVKKLLGNP